MKRLVVQETTIGGWDVLDVNAGHTSLYRSDRIRAEGWARQHSAVRGGNVTVVAGNGVTLAEYAVKAWTREPSRGEGSGSRAGGRRLRPLPRR